MQAGRTRGPEQLSPATELAANSSEHAETVQPSGKHEFKLVDQKIIDQDPKPGRVPELHGQVNITLIVGFKL